MDNAAQLFDLTEIYDFFSCILNDAILCIYILQETTYLIDT